MEIYHNSYDNLFFSSYCNKCGELKDNNDIKEVENGVFWCLNCRYDFTMEMMNIEE